MLKKLVKHGNSFALVIDKPILDLLKITSDTPLEITTDGKGLYVTSPRNEAKEEIGDEEFESVLNDINTRYADVFKRLAQ